MPSAKSRKKRSLVRPHSNLLALPGNTSKTVSLVDRYWQQRPTFPTALEVQPRLEIVLREPRHRQQELVRGFTELDDGTLIDLVDDGRHPRQLTLAIWRKGKISYSTNHRSRGVRLVAPNKTRSL